MKRKTLLIAVILSMVLGLLPAVSAYADNGSGSKTYDVTFTYREAEFTLRKAKPGTDSACVSFTRLAQLIEEAIGGSYTTDDIGSVGDQDGYFETVGNRIRLTRAFHGTIILVVRESHVDTAHLIEVSCREHESGSHGHAEDEAYKPVVVNPDTVEGYLMQNGNPLSGVVMGKMKQGPAAQALFNAYRPVGWKDAFTFNIAINGETDYSLKSGILTVYIPAELRKAGRSFALMGIDKNGNVKLFTDTDKDPLSITVDLNLEGYAFDLIYFD